MMEFSGRKELSTQLNIAPLIDVVFLLLIFFMLSSHFVMQPGIKITLPSTITAKVHQQEDIIIYITKHNNIYLNEEQVSLNNLLDKLRIKIGEVNKKDVIIKADEKIDLSLAVEVMDIARQADADGLIISTKVKEDDK